MRRYNNQHYKPSYKMSEWDFRGGRLYGMVTGSQIKTDPVIRMNLNEGWAETQRCKYVLLNRREEVRRRYGNRLENSKAPELKR